MARRRSLIAGWVCLAVLLGSASARAQFEGASATAAADPEPSAVRLTDRLGYRPWVDGPITAAVWLGYFGTEAFKAHLGPQACRWCAPDAVDWSVRNALVWSSPGAARAASDVLLYAVAPLAALGTTAALGYADGKRDEVLWDALLILEAGGAAAATTQLVKFFVARQRPYAYAAALTGEAIDREVDDNLSFFSGHSSFTFGLAAAMGTVASMRGRRYAWVAWAVGLPLATFTAYLRLAGDKHYLTDVAVGTGVGLAVGTLVPAVHDWDAFRGRRVSVAVLPTPGGAAAAFAMAW